MKLFQVLLFGGLVLASCWTAQAAEPLRVYIRSGPKTHGPGQHDYPKFLQDWTALLNERGAVAQGGNKFPSREELEKTDVLVLHAEEAGNINIGEERKNLLEFQKRGGGLVVIHGGAVSRDSAWYKQIIGGSWKHGQTKWLEGHMSLYFTDRENPITKGFSNFDLDDEIYYDMDLLPEVRVLAAAYTPKADGARNDAAKKKAEISTEGGKRVSIYDIQPQVWTYEKNGSRSFVAIPGHKYENFSHVTIRTMLLRGISWAAKRENVDELCKAEELGDVLRYPVGGPTRPELAAEKLEVHPEFEISLVAAEPLVNKPFNLEWDEKGRLWVVESPEYPNGLRQVNTETWKDTGSVKPGEYERKPLDRISILRDTDGDGVMDTKHVFADNLELATSFVLHRNGVIVSAAPDIWYLEDTDGDAVADKRTKLYTGLGTGDTHAVMNNMRWGADGWIYTTHGYSAGEVQALGKGASKELVQIGSGVVRFKPDGTAIEMFSSKNGNTWGLEAAWNGDIFWTQPTSGTVFFHTVLPEYVLGKGRLPGVNGWNGMITRQTTYPLMNWEQQAYVQIDQVGQFTAAAGCAVYEGGAWPDKWNHSYFTGEATINLVHHQFVKREGASYTVEKEKGREETEFIRSSDLWFRPIETKIGPDGALYLIDFYNQAVIHNDTRGPQHGPANAAVRPDRDHYFGRIWKVQHKQAKKLDAVVFDRDKISEVVNAFRTHPNVQVRNTAWRILMEEYGKDEEVHFSNLMFGSAAPYFSVKTDKAPASKDKPYLSFVRDGLKDGEFGSVVVSATKLKADKLDDAVVENIIKELAQPKLLAPMSYYRYHGAVDRKAVRAGMLDHFARAEDDWTRSAIIAVASDVASDFIHDALHQTKYESMKFAPLVSVLVEKALISGQAAEVIKSCAGVGEHGKELVSVAVATLAKGQVEAPEMDEALQAALRKLLANRSTAAEVLPLVVKWDNKGVLAKETKKQREFLASSLRESYFTDAERMAAVISLIQVGREEDIELAARMLGKEDVSVKLQRDVISALGANGQAKHLVEALVVLTSELLEVAFDEIVKRADATMLLLDAMEAEKVVARDIGPGNVARLRTHPDRAVAERAVKLLDKMNPAVKAKEELLAKLLPEVTKPGNVEQGKVMFAAACAVCHKYGDVGVRDVGPPLNGMGAHGAAELLTHVVDPNREVDPSFWQWNITKKNGDSLTGVIVSENAATVVLRNQAGDVEIRKEEIDARVNTRRSLMPEGLEGLGAEVLRDILAFMTAGDQKFRVLDLRQAYTADSRRGLFANAEAKRESVFPKEFGNVEAHGIPFFLMDPQRSANGLNLVALKGGTGDQVARSYPQKVELDVNVQAKRLHLLSGIAGWGWPAVKDELAVLKVTLEHVGGEKEVIELKNGVEFADYIREVEVPGSKLVKGMVEPGQLRLITVQVKKPGAITKVVLESYAHQVTPVVLAMTADVDGIAGVVEEKKPTAEVETGPKQGGKGDGPLAPVKETQWEDGKTKVLVVGGGSSHDFAKFFGTTDVETLKAAGFSVHYTEDRDQVVKELANADVAVISVNRKFFDTAAYRKALMEFAAAGKGVVMLHPGTWYAYPQWPELNAKIVGGGSRGHDKLGEFTVKVVNQGHAVMKGVPESFEVVDELYYVNAEGVPEGTVEIEVLAETSASQKYGKSHPSVWVAKHPQAKVVNIALGHDERVHDMEAFKAILKNAVGFVSGK